MSIRVTFLSVALAVAAITGLGHPAAAKAASGWSASSSYSADCQSGATCRHTEQVDGASRSAATSASFARTQLSTVDESVTAYGDFAQTVPLPKGRTSASVTLAWHVDAANADASSSRGSVYSTSLLRASIVCAKGCTTSAAQVQVTLACSEEGVTGCVDPTNDPGHVVDRDYTLTVSATGLTGSSFTLRTNAESFVVAQATCGPAPSGALVPPLEDNCGYRIDPSHAGSGTADLSAHLVSAQVTTG